MRIAYVKSGDVVAALEQLEAGGLDDDGGPDGFLADLLRSLAGDELLLLGVGAGVTQTRAAASTRLGLQITARALPAARRRARLRAAWRIAVQLCRHRPAVVICGKCGFPLWSSALVARLRGARLIHSRHNWHERSARGGWLARQLDAWLVRRADGVLCHGPYLRDRLLASGVPAARLQVFDSGNRTLVARTRAAARRQSAAAPGPEIETQPTERPLQVLYCGRIVHAKGVFDLLDALTPLFERYPTLQLRYLGDGPDLPELQAEVRRLGLTRRVCLAGAVAHAAVGQHIQASRVVVTPTRSQFPEGRCMVAMEALALGVPVIAPVQGPFPYLVKHGVNGLLYEPDAVPSLQRALTRVLAEDALWQGLREGARRTGAALLAPSVTFAQAFARALAPHQDAVPAPAPGVSPAAPGRVEP